jgi:hypothetical protein
VSRNLKVLGNDVVRYKALGDAGMVDTSLTLTRCDGAKHRATPEADIQLTYGGSATISDDQKHLAADYKSEGRRLESCQAQLNVGISRS